METITLPGIYIFQEDKPGGRSPVPFEFADIETRKGIYKKLDTQGFIRLCENLCEIINILTKNELNETNN